MKSTKCIGLALMIKLLFLIRPRKLYICGYPTVPERRQESQESANNNRRPFQKLYVSLGTTPSGICLVKN